MSNALRLEDEAPMLLDLPLVDIEMPGLYAAHVAAGEPPPPDGEPEPLLLGTFVLIVSSGHRNAWAVCSTRCCWGAATSRW